ncbi:hypothetical protein HYW76_04810 [Candidatus Pacearchaeota archaeon]|nr:hypothetical protein [Candidatus Pacearchaeota archaeon]
MIPEVRPNKDYQETPRTNFKEFMTREEVIKILDNSVPPRILARLPKNTRYVNMVPAGSENISPKREEPYQTTSETEAVDPTASTQIMPVN